MINELAEHLLTAWVMWALWASVTLLAAFVAWRMRMTGLFVVAAGALPWAVFYLWTAMGWWSSVETAVAYSRFAGAFLAINLIVGLIVMCRLACERRRIWKQL
jgi:hypothetical protein